MNSKWAENELLSVDLKDQRLNKRCVKIRTSFSNSPISPINQACDDWSETKSADFNRNIWIKFTRVFSE